MRATLALTLLLAAGNAHADGPGTAMLEKIDKALSNFDDQQILFAVENQKPGANSTQSMRFEARVQGGKSIMKFLEPGDLKGTRVLSLSPTQMWIYLPEFSKVRRVASHALANGFMGTTLTQQDMAPPTYAALFDATIASDSDTEVVLDMTAKDPDTVAYGKMRMYVEKERTLPTKIEYLDEKGEVARTETRGDYDCNEKGYCMFGVMKMVDHTRGDAWTTLTPIEKQVDVGMDEQLFTVRTLQMGF